MWRAEAVSATGADLSTHPARPWRDPEAKDGRLTPVRSETPVLFALSLGLPVGLLESLAQARQSGFGAGDDGGRDASGLRLADVAGAELGALAPVGIPIGAVAGAALAGATGRLATFAELQLIGDVQIIR